MEGNSAPRPPASDHLNAVRILAVPLVPPIHVKFLGALRGLLTHWSKSHSVPCDGPDKCPVALHRTGTFFKAYAPVEWWVAHVGRWRPAVLEGTANLEERLRGRTLRGEVWLLSREKETDKASPVLARYCESLPEPSLSPAFDILPVLQRVFNREELLLDVANPTPRKVLLPEVAGAPPALPDDLKPAPPVEEDPEEKRKMREAVARAKQLGYMDDVGAGSNRNQRRSTSAAEPKSNGSQGNGHF